MKFIYKYHHYIHCSIYLYAPAPSLKKCYFCYEQIYLSLAGKVLSVCKVQNGFITAPPTKLWEGNVFTCVCLSVHRGPHLTITHDALGLTVQGPPPALPPPNIDMGPPQSHPLLVISGDHHWKPVQTCSFDDSTGTAIWWSKHKKVGKRAVCILLKCFLVNTDF